MTQDPAGEGATLTRDPVVMEIGTAAPSAPGSMNMKNGIMTLEKITKDNIGYAIQIQESLFPGESGRANFEDSLEAASGSSSISGRVMP